MNSYKSSPMNWSWGVSPALHRNHKQNRTKGSKLQPSQLLSTTPCLVDGQVRVVVVAMVVINAHFFSLSLKKVEPKKVDYKHRPPKRWMCVNSPWVFLDLWEAGWWCDGCGLGDCSAAALLLLRESYWACAFGTHRTPLSSSCVFLSFGCGGPVTSCAGAGPAPYNLERPRYYSPKFSPTHALALYQFTNAEEVVCNSVISLQPTDRILLEYQLQHRHQKPLNHKKDWRIEREIALGQLDTLVRSSILVGGKKNW